jgi:hypothetical protein
MKLKLAVVLLMVAAIALGFFVGRFHAGSYAQHRDAEHEVTEAIDLAVQGTETSAALQATLGVRAIEFIDSGDTQQAVQLLSGPIARYYTLYPLGRNDERSEKLRGLIEELARTNQVVAARITEISNMSSLKKP